MQKKNTPPKFNIAPEKWWLEDYFPIGKVNFSGAMLNFGRVSYHIWAQWTQKDEISKPRLLSGVSRWGPSEP